MGDGAGVCAGVRGVGSGGNGRWWGRWGVVGARVVGVGGKEGGKYVCYGRRGGCDRCVSVGGVRGAGERKDVSGGGNGCGGEVCVCGSRWCSRCGGKENM